MEGDPAFIIHGKRQSNKLKVTPSQCYTEANKTRRRAAGRADYSFKAPFTRSARPRKKPISGLVELM